ncbi:MAG: Glu-tRNA(Gln) amidotransferase subunit GatE [Candidatus Micrarchaeota archaeon]|nr:Glu-tRNA(Gln) amidotransferase subunit GatE [Candidatus Micrarchaeota archaeon]
MDKGIKIGLELHQRLATKNKLFCRCSTKGNEEKIKEIKRKLHAVPSELGQIDPAALFESKKAPLHKYDFYKGTCCLVEADDEPPHEMNSEAVILGLTICNMLNAEIVDEIHVMRKTVIDGSNTSGFQRTAILGLNGKLKYENEIEGRKEEKEIGIQTIAIEEESCGIIGEQKGEIESFRLDRLGIPLVEIATTPDIKNGREARTVAEQIGLMLRATGKMMRGIGTIRQDLNISVSGGARVEIKGVQDLDLIETVVENEIKRQTRLIEICEKIKKIREIRPELDDLFENEYVLEQCIKEVTELFNGTGSKLIKKSVESGKSVFAMKFPGMKGIFGIELYPDYRYGSELSDYAKTQGLGGIIHSDENIEKYNLKNEVSEIVKILKLEPNDGWIVVVGEKEQCISALKLVFKRAYETKVPEETRRADLQGKTHYMRPLPGSARMYPETDVAPIRITDSMLSESQDYPSFEEIENRVYSLLNREIGGKIIRSEKLNLFLELVEEGINPVVAAVTCEDTLKSLKRDGFEIAKLSEEDIKEALLLYRDEKITKAAIPELLKEMIKRNGHANEVIKDSGLFRISGEELKGLIIKENIKDVQSLMVKYRLNVDPQEASKIISELKK